MGPPQRLKSEERGRKRRYRVAWDFSFAYSSETGRTKCSKNGETWNPPRGLLILFVEDAGVQKRLSDLTVDFFAEVGAKAKEKLEALKAGGDDVSEALLMELQTTTQYAEGLSMARDAGYDPIFYNAPAIVVFHSAAGGPSPKDDCLIASTIMGLTARTMGLETTYIGFLETSSKTSEPVIKELDLPQGHEVFSVLIMGYPKFKYVRTVDRRQIATMWK